MHSVRTALFGVFVLLGMQMKSASCQTTEEDENFFKTANCFAVTNYAAEIWNSMTGDRSVKLGLNSEGTAKLVLQLDDQRQTLAEKLVVISLSNGWDSERLLFRLNVANSAIDAEITKQVENIATKNDSAEAYKLAEDLMLRSVACYAEFMIYEAANDR